MRPLRPSSPEAFAVGSLSLSLTGDRKCGRVGDSLKDPGSLCHPPGRETGMGARSTFSRLVRDAISGQTHSKRSRASARPRASRLPVTDVRRAMLSVSGVQVEDWYPWCLASRVACLADRRRNAGMPERRKVLMCRVKATLWRLAWRVLWCVVWIALDRRDLVNVV
jgi:hypothetical protein